MVENKFSEHNSQTPQFEPQEPVNAPRKAPIKPNIPSAAKLNAQSIYPTMDISKDQTITTKTTVTKPRTKKSAKGVTEQISKTTVKAGVVSHSEKKVIRKTSKDGTKTVKTVTETVVSKPSENLAKPPIQRARPARPSFPSPKPTTQILEQQVLQGQKIMAEPETTKTTFGQNVASNLEAQTDLPKQQANNQAQNLESEVLTAEGQPEKNSTAPEEKSVNAQSTQSETVGESTIAPEEMSKAKTELESEILNLYQATKSNPAPNIEVTNQEEEGLSLSKRDKILIGLVLFIIILGALVVLIVPGIMPLS